MGYEYETTQKPREPKALSGPGKLRFNNIGTENSCQIRQILADEGNTPALELAIHKSIVIRWLRSEEDGAVLEALPPSPCVTPADLQRAFLMARNGMAGDPGGI